MLFSSKHCLIQDSNTKKKIGSAKEHNGVYHLDLDQFSYINLNSSTTFTIRCNKEDLWHYRLGHLSSNRLAIINKKFPDVTVSSNLVCDICSETKFPISTSVCASAFDFLHADIWGPNVIFMNGSRYFLTIVDDCGRFTWAICMKAKSDASDLIKQFCCMVKNLFSKSVKIIRTDNGPEFNLVRFYASSGIIHQKSCVETPQQNGIAERKHQHILNVARCLKLQSKLPTTF